MLVDLIKLITLLNGVGNAFGVMEIIKEVFEERYNNEFQYYGYMYPYNELK